MALPKPITRQESYLANIAGEENPLPEDPITREEIYLDYIAKNGGGGGGGGEEKADKVIGATSGNFAGLDETGNLTDSGSKASDFYQTNDEAESDIDDLDYVPFYDTSATAKKKTLWSTIKSALRIYFDGRYNKYLENSSVTLSTSTTTTVTFTDAAITADSVIDFACTVWDLVPDDMTATTGTCTITLPQVDSAMTVGVRLYIRS